MLVTNEGFYHQYFTFIWLECLRNWMGTERVSLDCRYYSLWDWTFFPWSQSRRKVKTVTLVTLWFFWGGIPLWALVLMLSQMSCSFFLIKWIINLLNYDDSQLQHFSFLKTSAFSHKLLLSFPFLSSISPQKPFPDNMMTAISSTNCGNYSSGTFHITQ